MDYGTSMNQHIVDQLMAPTPQQQSMVGQSTRPHSNGLGVPVHPSPDQSPSLRETWNGLPIQQQQLRKPQGGIIRIKNSSASAENFPAPNKRGAFLELNNYKDFVSNYPPNTPNYDTSVKTYTPSTDDPALIHNQQMGVYPDRRDILGTPQLPYSSYPNNMTTTNLWQIPQRLTERADYIMLYSGDRDRTKFPSPAQYTVQTGSRFKNIKAIEIVQIIYPSTDAVKNEPYLNLVIPQIGGNYFASNTPSSNALAIVTPGIEVVGTTASWFKAKIDSLPYLTKVNRDGSILASIQDFTVEWQRIDGTLFNFGVDNAANLPPKPEIQNQITLKLYYLEPDTGEIGRNNP